MFIKQLEALETETNETEVSDSKESIKRTYIITIGLEKNLKDLARELALEGIKLSDSALVRFALTRGLPLVRERLINQQLD